MGHKIFISYKYADSSVLHLERTPWYEITTVRHYVDELQDKLEEGSHINKGEKDGEDLSNFKDSTIASKLRDKIYDSSVTVVLISPCMFDRYKSEKEQWIPWEISYSLREATRCDRTSRTNGILAVVLPDSAGNYDYMLEKKTCCQSNCNLWHTDKLFKILRLNMFNKYEQIEVSCEKGDKVYRGFSSYIHMIKWDSFINNLNFWIETAISIRDNRDAYELHVNVD